MTSKQEENRNIIEVTVGDNDFDQYNRLDKFLADKLENINRSMVKKLFLDDMITIAENNNNTIKKLELKKMPKPETILKIQLPENDSKTIKPEDIPLEIIYEDEHLLFINKATGMVTHPAPGNYSGTLVNALLHYYPAINKVGDEKRSGIVHRLDKGTSGVMVVAKTKECHTKMIELFSNHDIERKYEALVMGPKIPSTGILESTIGRHHTNRLKMAANIPNGKDAITNYQVLSFYTGFTHMELSLQTGRTHQIRVHLSSLLRHQIMCDPLYGNPAEHLKRLGGKFKTLLKNYQYPLLHAKSLGLIHPISGKRLFFSTPLPDIFKKVIAIETEKMNE